MKKTEISLPGLFMACACLAACSSPDAPAEAAAAPQTEGKKAVVYFTRDLSAAGLRRAFKRVSEGIEGKVGVKLHTGEPHGSNIISRPWVKELIEQDLPGASIVETNTYYEMSRHTTELHCQTIATNGWTFCPVDILDEEGTVDFSGGRRVVRPYEHGRTFGGL